jgi:DNA-binding NarL/FixJ family response regulator
VAAGGPRAQEPTAVRAIRGTRGRARADPRGALGRSTREQRGAGGGLDSTDPAEAWVEKEGRKSVGKNGKTRVLLVDDHLLFTDIMRTALEGLGMEVLEPVTTATDAIRAALRERPDLILMDLKLPRGQEIEAGRAILREMPDVKVVAVTESRNPRNAMDAIRAGFRGFVTKSNAMSEFESSIRAVLDGQVLVPDGFRGPRIQDLGNQDGERRHAALLLGQLTSRELEILSHLAGGASGATIADRLTISQNTVRTHIQSLLSKLQVHSRLEAAAFAVRHGVVVVRSRTSA